METLSTEYVEIVREESKVCKRDEFDISGIGDG